MDMNQLKINMSKTEFIRFENQRQLDKCTTNSCIMAQKQLIRWFVLKL